MNAPAKAALDLLRQLVAIPTISSTDAARDCDNLAALELLANHFSDLGFSVELMPLANANGKRKANLIARAGSAEDTEGLVLSGHIDTVPFDTAAEAGWQSDPLTLTEKDAALYGLGSADMKAFFACVLMALREHPLAGITQPLTIVATADEESTMTGAKALLARGKKLGRFALIGEPTGLQPIRMHKGVMMEAIRLRGRSGHASDPALGASALEAMHKVMGTLKLWRKEAQARFYDAAFTPPAPTLNFGCINGGDAPNRICADCELQIDLRLLPGMEAAAIRTELNARVQTAIAGSGVTAEWVPLFAGLPPFCTHAQSSMISACESASGQASGAVAFGTEAPFFSQLGMETVVLGAGSISVAHRANEHVPLTEMAQMATILGKLINKFCRH